MTLSRRWSARAQPPTLHKLRRIPDRKQYETCDLKRQKEFRLTVGAIINRTDTGRRGEPIRKPAENRAERRERSAVGTENVLIEQIRYPIALTKHEAAQMLGVSVRTIDRLIALKELQVRRLGRRVLIPRTALESLLHRDHPTQVT